MLEVMSGDIKNKKSLPMQGTYTEGDIFWKVLYVSMIYID